MNLFQLRCSADSCVFTIIQGICVAVPVEFGAVAIVGDTFVSYNEVIPQV